jgi:hypothetical protein
MAETVQPAPIEEWRGIDAARFRDEIVPRNRPAVLRGVTEHWPLVEHYYRSPQALVDYLIGLDNGALVSTAIAPPEAGGRFIYKDGMKALNHRRSDEKLPNVLKGLLKLIDDPHPPGISIGGLRAADQMPDLERQNGTDLVPGGTRAHLWIGNAVVVSPHFDAADNLAVVVAGRRRFTLFPPEQVSNLYVGPTDLTPAGVPVSMVPHDVPDFERYPRFRDALAAAVSAELGPGDAIYVPYLWWHGVESLEPVNMLVNFWWYSDPVAAQHPHGALLRASYQLFRNLPAEHREAWRRMYEYWVFEAQGDPMKDLPEVQHTATARLDPEAIVRFKQSLAELFDGAS